MPFLQYFHLSFLKDKCQYHVVKGKRRDVLLSMPIPALIVKEKLSLPTSNCILKPWEKIKQTPGGHLNVNVDISKHSIPCIQQERIHTRNLSPPFELHCWFKHSQLCPTLEILIKRNTWWIQDYLTLTFKALFKVNGSLSINTKKKWSERLTPLPRSLWRTYDNSSYRGTGSLLPRAVKTCC